MRNAVLIACVFLVICILIAALSDSARTVLQRHYVHRWLVDSGMRVNSYGLYSKLRAERMLVAEFFRAFVEPFTTDASGTGAGASGTGAGASGTGAGASGTGADASGTGAGASGTGTGASGTGAGASGTGAGASGTGADASKVAEWGTCANDNDCGTGLKCLYSYPIEIDATRMDMQRCLTDAGAQWACHTDSPGNRGVWDPTTRLCNMPSLSSEYDGKTTLEKLGIIRSHLDAIDLTRSDCLEEFQPILVMLEVLNPDMYTLDQDFRDYLADFLVEYFVQVIKFNEDIYGLRNLCDMVNPASKALYDDNVESERSATIASLGACLHTNKWKTHAEILGMDDNDMRAIIANELAKRDGETRTAPTFVAMTDTDLFGICDDYYRYTLDSPEGATSEDVITHTKLMTDLLEMLRYVVDNTHMGQNIQHNNEGLYRLNTKRVDLQTEIQDKIASITASILGSSTASLENSTPAIDTPARVPRHVINSAHANRLPKPFRNVRNRLRRRLRGRFF